MSVEKKIADALSYKLKFLWKDLETYHEFCATWWLGECADPRRPLGWFMTDCEVCLSLWNTFGFTAGTFFPLFTAYFSLLCICTLCLYAYSYFCKCTYWCKQRGLGGNREKREKVTCCYWSVVHFLYACNLTYTVRKYKVVFVVTVVVILTTMVFVVVKGLW